MRAYEIQTGTDIDGLREVERPSPPPGPGQVKVHVRAVSLNYRDLNTVRHAAVRKLRLPLIPCSDGAGEVAEVGAGVTRVREGDRVAGIFTQAWLDGPVRPEYEPSSLGGGMDGMLAEYVTLSQEGLVHLPPHLSFEEGSTLPCAAVTAWNGMFVADHVQAGDTILVQGTGGVSIFALQFGVMTGARVIVTSKSDAKLAHAAELGAADTINYETEPEWDRRVRELTGGRGVDHVVEVGGAGTLERSFRAARIGGAISLIGILSGAHKIDPMPVLTRRLRLLGITVGSREMFEAMNRAIAVNELRPVIDRVYPFEQARDALRYLESAAHFGKIVITV